MLLFNVMPIAVECAMALGVMATLAGSSAEFDSENVVSLDHTVRSPVPISYYYIVDIVV